MSKSSSAPKYKSYSIDSNISNYKSKSRFPRIPVNPLINSSNFSENKKDIMRDFNEKYPLYNNDVSNVITNINNNLNRNLRANNEIAQDQINTIRNSYDEIRLLLDEKANRLEKNNKKIIDYMKYSLDQDELKNKMNDNRYKNYIKNMMDNNSSNRENLLRILSQVPPMIQNKINQIYKDELEENRNQHEFLNHLKEEVISILKNQRKADIIRHRKQINELKKLKENEEKEKIQLINELQQRKHNFLIHKNNLKIYKHKKQKLKYKSDSVVQNQYQNQYQYQPPIYNNQMSQIVPMLPPYYYQNPNLFYQGMNNNSVNSGDKGLSIDELIKIFLLKEMMNNQQRLSERIYDNLLNIRTYKYPKISHSHSTDNYYHSLNLYNQDKYKHLQKTNRTNRANRTNNSLKNNDNNINKLNDERNIKITNNIKNENKSQENLIPFVNVGSSFVKNNENKNNNKRFTTYLYRKSQISHSQKTQNENIEDNKGKVTLEHKSIDINNQDKNKSQKNKIEKSKSVKSSEIVQKKDLDKISNKTDLVKNRKSKQIKISEISESQKRKNRSEASKSQGKNNKELKLTSNESDKSKEKEKENKEDNLKNKENKPEENKEKEESKNKDNKTPESSSIQVSNSSKSIEVIKKGTEDKEKNEENNNNNENKENLENKKIDNENKNLENNENKKEEEEEDEDEVEEEDDDEENENNN